jgi:hypothetical protein
MAMTSDNLTPTNLFPEFICCGGALRFVIHHFQDGESWEARCPKCKRVWWLECIGVEDDIMKELEAEAERVRVRNNT